MVHVVVVFYVFYNDYETSYTTKYTRHDVETTHVYIAVWIRRVVNHVIMHIARVI